MEACLVKRCRDDQGGVGWTQEEITQGMKGQ
jgi:hypothetical protein